VEFSRWRECFSGKLSISKGFVRIRNFGFLANRKRAKLLPLCFHLLGTTPQPQAESHPSGTKNSSPSWRCPKCGGPMKVIERFTAAELQLRSPPKVTAAACKNLWPPLEKCSKTEKMEERTLETYNE
jgi:hypothetical protein